MPVYLSMISAKLGAFILSPLIALAVFFGWAHRPPAVSQPAPITIATSTPATSTPPVTTTPPVVVTPPIVQGIDITSATPASGPVGTEVTLSGSGFTSNDVVLFGGGAIAAVHVSSNGTKLSFVVPSSAGPYCKPDQACPMYEMLVTPNTYKVSVENTSNYVTSVNSISFTVI